MEPIAIVSIQAALRHLSAQMFSVAISKAQASSSSTPIGRFRHQAVMRRTARFCGVMTSAGMTGSALPLLPNGLVTTATSRSQAGQSRPYASAIAKA